LLQAAAVLQAVALAAAAQDAQLPQLAAAAVLKAHSL
jgi:hypothetical protein